MGKGYSFCPHCFHGRPVSTSSGHTTGLPSVRTAIRFIWKWSSSREFFSNQAYRALFVGRTPIAGADRIWKVQAVGRCRFFGWLVLHSHCWTLNRLCHHGLRDSDDCALCAQEVETWEHLLLRCGASDATEGVVILQMVAGCQEIDSQASTQRV
jgi:hypothetical protein